MITYCDLAWPIEPLKVHFNSLDPSIAGHLRNVEVLSLVTPCSCIGSVRLAFGYGERRRCEGDDEREDRREGVYSTFPRMMMSDSSARPVGRTPKLMIFPRERETAEGRGNGGKRLGPLHPILHLLFIAQLHSDHGKAKKRRDFFEKGGDCKPLSVPLQRRGCELSGQASSDSLS